MNYKKGFAIKEMIFLSGFLAVFFAVAITRVSFAYTEALRKEELDSDKKHVLVVAAESYAKAKSEKFKSLETFLYGSDLIESGFLMDIEDTDYSSAKIRVTHEENSTSYHAEVVE